MVDTAWQLLIGMYAIPVKPETHGETEKAIGSCLVRRPDRDKIVLASKIPGRNPQLTVKAYSWWPTPGQKQCLPRL